MSIISSNSVIMKQINNARSIDLGKLKADAIKANDETIVQINRGQMRGSRTGAGSMPDYSQTTLGLKDFSNYVGQYPKFDLFDSGSFQDAMFMTVSGNQAVISSRDSKTSSLVGRLGEDIFQLDNQSEEQAKGVVTPSYNKLVHNYLNK